MNDQDTYTEGSLLEIFDKAGLLPSIALTSAFISKHKRTVSAFLSKRDVLVFQTSEHNEDTAYGLNTFHNAIDRIQRIIEVNGLAFYPVLKTDKWKSHWNPKAPDERWQSPIPEWNESLARFHDDRARENKRQVLISSHASYRDRVTRKQMKDNLSRLTEELEECQQESDSLRKTIQWMLAGTARSEQEDEDMREDFHELSKSITNLTRENAELEGKCTRYREERRRYERNKEAWKVKLENSEACNKALQLSVDQVTAELGQARAKLDAFKATEEQQQQAIKEIEDSEEFAAFQKECHALHALSIKRKSLAESRHKRKIGVRTRLGRYNLSLQKAVQKEESKAAQLSAVEDQLMIYEEIARDGDENGDTSDMDGDTAIDLDKDSQQHS